MIGVVLDKIDHSILSFNIFSCLNELSKKHNCYVFSNEVLALPMKNNFAILQQSSIFQHHGVLISTSFLNTQTVNNSLMADKKYFYLQNLDWYSIENINYGQISSIIHNPELELIARGKTHYDVISKVLKKPKHLIVNWDAEELERAVLNE